MIPIPLTPYQIELIERPVQTRLFLEGLAGSGKTSVGVGRMLALLEAGAPASSLLLLVPQRTLALPYQDALRTAQLAPGGQVSVLTVGGLARRMVDLFWPLVAEEAGFARPNLPPSFLTLETALYYMAHLVRPLLEQGLFDSVTIDRNRVYSQIIDNLNKAAIVGFPYTDIGERLKAGWPQDTAQLHVYEDAQRCATLFREYCLQNNLLDFSLQVEIFSRSLWNKPAVREHLRNSFQHLIADNIEEDTPVAHDLLREWLPEFDSALLIYDQEAGYRRFLGADPDTAYALLDLCDEHHIFTDTLVAIPEVRSFCGQFGRALERPNPDGAAPQEDSARQPDAARHADAKPLRSEQLASALDFPEKVLRFYPQMLDWVVERVDGLIRQGTPPGEIVLLAPLLPDSLRFALASRLAARGIPYRSHRPSRSLREEPATQALLTLAELAHPDWGFRPSNFEVAYAFMQTIEGLDLVRAQLLIEAGYRSLAGRAALLPFERIRAETQERITYLAGTRYEALRHWLDDYMQEPAAELDFFFSRLFGEVLSQPGYAFHANYDAGTVCANLIESAQKFRWAVENRTPAPADPEQGESPLGKEYIRMIQDGVLAAQYIQSWQIPEDDAVLIAPAYTFLLSNRPVEHQFWLDVGSPAWAERLYQPLTHPYILSRAWDRARIWTDVDEYEHNRDTLYRSVLGLARRCRQRIHLGLCDLSESGYESRGLLLRAIQMVMQQSRGYR
jgi:hypothetical protein